MYVNLGNRYLYYYSCPSPITFVIKYESVLVKRYSNSVIDLDRFSLYYKGLKRNNLLDDLRHSEEIIFTICSTNLIRYSE